MGAYIEALNAGNRTGTVALLGAILIEELYIVHVGIGRALGPVGQLHVVDALHD